MPLKDMRIKSTRWVVVINNPAASDEECVGRARQQDWTVHGQIEKGAKTGTPHYQIYLKTPHIRASQVKKMFPRGYIDIANGTEKDNTDYATKEETRVGDLPTTAFVSQLQLWDLVWEYIQSQGCVFVKRPACKTRPENNVHLEYFQQDEIGCLVRVVRIEQSDDGNLAILYQRAIHQIIQDGKIIESIAVNPQTLSAWKNYSLSILYRSYRRQTDRQTANILVPTMDITNGAQEDEGSASQRSEEDSHSFSPDEEGSRQGDSEDYCSG